MPNDFPEAPASNTFKVKSPKGFEHLFTMRDETVKGLMAKIETIEDILLDKGWVPLAQNAFQKREKVIEYVEGRVCPKCGQKLVYNTTKAGKKFIKCSTNKWDVMTKQSTGCSYVDWMDSPTS